MAAHLTDKQKRFVTEYLIDLNATQAAIRAGYSKKTAQRIGSELLSKPLIQAEIQKRQLKLQEKSEITQERVIQELAAIGFANGADFAKIIKGGGVLFTPTSDLPASKLPAIAGIKESVTGVEVKLHDKVRALELLGKYLGLFDGNNAKTAPDNNLFDAIKDCAKGDYDELPEVQQAAEADTDMVE